VAEVVAAARAYGRETGRRVSYEYVMIDGINDTPVDAEAVAGLLAGSGAHVNCIPMNPVAHTPWKASGPQRIEAFASRLRAAGIGVTIRRNRGQEVGAACGQLAAELAGEPPAPAVARRRERLVSASAAALRGERTTDPPPPGVGRDPNPAMSRRGAAAARRRWPATCPRPPRHPTRPRRSADAGGPCADRGEHPERRPRQPRPRGPSGGQGRTDRIHLDVMDAHFVPNLTFGWTTIAQLRPVTRTPFDAHLMIAQPGRWVDHFLAAAATP